MRGDGDHVVVADSPIVAVAAFLDEDEVEFDLDALRDCRLLDLQPGHAVLPQHDRLAVDEDLDLVVALALRLGFLLLVRLHLRLLGTVLYQGLEFAFANSVATRRRTMPNCVPEFVMKNRQLSLFEQRQIAWGLSDEATMRELCEELLDLGEVEPPIDVELLASLRGIVSIRSSLQGPAGMLVCDGERLHVTVRASDGRERRRFTVLHEAGHTMFPGFLEAPQYRCKGPKDREEQLCDLAASELLLPRRFLIPDLASTGFGMGAVEQLADGYKASIESTALRMADLWPRRAMVLVFSVCHKPSEAGHEASTEPKVRLNYAHQQGRWPFARRHKSVADNSPIGRAMMGEIVNEIGTLTEILGSDEPLRITARRYGTVPRVLALVTPAKQPRLLCAA